MRILVDSPAFMEQLARDLAEARRSVVIQAMSFEGDPSGERLVRLLRTRPDLERTLIVDRYSLVFLSDRFLPFPRNAVNPALWRERRSTLRLLRELRRDGVRVRWTNPLGFLLRKYMARNHKKLALLDDRVTYLGGINLCDHNFAWHDLMLRIDDPALGAFVRRDVESTLRGEHSGAWQAFGDVEIFCLDGRHNPDQYGPLIRLIQDARRSIVVESPYVTFPFFGFLGNAVRRGVSVTLVAPLHNNKAPVSSYVQWAAAEAGVTLRLFTGPMSHVKAMLVDDEALVVGSSNFDYVSYTTQQEILAVVRNADVIGQYRRLVLEPDLARSVQPAGIVSPAREARRERVLRRLARVAVPLSRL